MKKKYVLQLCHDYNMPFMDVARQYASLFQDTDYGLITVFLIGGKNDDVAKKVNSERVIFLENSSRDLRGLKRKQIEQIRRICGQYDFKFSIAHRYQAFFILRHIKNLPVIGVHHRYGVYKRFRRRWFVNINKKNLYLLGVSNAIRDDIRRSLPNISQNQIHSLYNRIDIEQVELNQVNRFNAREYLGISQEKYVFANVGRLHPEKDQHTLISAFAKITSSLPNAILVILGKGPLESDLKSHVKELKIESKVKFMGVVPDAINYFKAFDCFVLSSNCEPFGMVLLEAIAAQLPIIATNTGGPKEIIKNKSCLFDVGDVKGLSELMSKICHITNIEKNNITQMNRRLMEDEFSYNAVKQAFWTLPFMLSLLSDTK